MADTLGKMIDVGDSESAIAESSENNPILGFEVSHMKCTTILLKEF